ncbi:pentapeptide repeat-containing protein [Streptomyces sp. NBC_00151]|uniref:pentapeptide repeat-containing protein n=1 Tax=Streptomyces sp. NBC_00151 TaxID=2975669 RepID=UPI002DD95510|nr:pentapeptide repeat-containing protein [Streptomyces sp. NBC_00151]WRZ37420.1 pentapeptide repeat-containing protein [Streptomyces sp. NBC_00151]
MTFTGTAWFGRATFTGDAWFDEVTFTGDARFDGATTGDAQFGGATFTVLSSFGPLLCAGQVDLSRCVFEAPVTMEIAAGEVNCFRTRWESTATLGLRYATVDLSHAVWSSPAAVTTHPGPFTTVWTPVVEESLLASRAPKVRVASVQGVEAAHLVLTDTDLSDCPFSGAFHLDQIRLEGFLFAPTPTGWHRRGIWPARWTRRRTLAEEHHWRARTARQSIPSAGEDPKPHLWRPGPHHTDAARTPDPEDVAALYRQLRKAFEDGKNEPGAADFYYGECEMRRHDLTGTPKSERRLLWSYWLLSEYGLRASRAFTWLLAAMSLTVLLLMGLGLPTHDPDPALHGEWPKRMTWARAEKATRIAVNSVVFRSSGQNLTTAGTYIEMTSRLLEPTLLALGVLAIRGRIKR